MTAGGEFNWKEDIFANLQSLEYIQGGIAKVGQIRLK